MQHVIKVLDHKNEDLVALNDLLAKGWEILNTLPFHAGNNYILYDKNIIPKDLKFPLCNPMSYRGDIDSNKSDDICVAKMVPIGSLIVTPDHRAFSVSK